jgi:hypothetical protein
MFKYRLRIEPTLRVHKLACKETPKGAESSSANSQYIEIQLVIKKPLKDQSL